MALTITASVEEWPVAGQFVISRGAMSSVDVLVVAVSDGHDIGMGESTAIYYEGESASKCLRQVMAVAEQVERYPILTAKDMIQSLLPEGAARNALDCALWDLAAKAAGMPLWRLIGLKNAPKSLVTAYTISLGEPAQMERDAARAAAGGYGLLKLKLTGVDDEARVTAVRRGAPNARLMVDANESWAKHNIMADAEIMAALGVEVIEQPVSRGQDHILDRWKSPVPLLADESCHNKEDIAFCARHYDGVNIKLDKAGGLTEAWRMADAAQAAGLKIMVGSMLSTSLGIAPAFLLAQRADWVDLDAPALLAQDRENGFQYSGGQIHAPK